MNGGLTAEARRALARIARAAAAAAVEGRPYAPAEPAEPEARVAGGGCFVTLKTDGLLRGCLGCFASDDPLWKTTAEYARASALDDPRFSGRRLTPAELPRLAIEVSALSSLAPCAEPEKIILGVHGIYVRAGGRSGCFLPQVAVETGWDAAEFWTRCCADKAGCAPDAWRSGRARCFTFTADVFEA